MKLDELQGTLGDLFEMANVQPGKTGLATYIYVSPKQGNHPPRIKVSNQQGASWSEDNFSVSVSDKPEVVAGSSKLSSEDLKRVFQFVIKNKEVLTKYWNHEIHDTSDALDQLKKI